MGILTSSSSNSTYRTGAPGELIGLRASSERIEADSQETDRSETYTLIYCTSSLIIELRNAKRIKRLPSVSIDEIEDKSKCDSFARIIAAGQITWNLVQIIARKAEGLGTSQLEIAVLAFSVCAIIIYGLNWKKPKGVQVPYLILSCNETMSSNLGGGSREHHYLNEGFDFFGLRKDSSIHSSIPNDRSTIPTLDKGGRLHGLIALALGGTTFGGIHMAAWSFAFPTWGDQFVWRLASLWCTISVLAVWLTFWSFIRFVSVVNDVPQKYVAPSCTFLYILARLFLIIEIFRTLFYLPSDVYMATWATSLPHLT